MPTVLLGLFHKAIMESGSALNYWSRGTRYAKKLAELLDFESEDEEEILKLLRELPASKIIEAQEKITYVSVIIKCLKGAVCVSIDN